MKRYNEYKDSGVEWIGEIPRSWDIKKLGYIASMIVPMRDKPTSFDGDIPWIRIEDFDGKYIEKSKTEQNVSKQLIKKMNLKIYPKGTVLCSCSCNMGETAIVSKPIISNQTFIGIVPGSKLISEYLYYLMISNKKRLDFLSSGAIQQYLSRTEFEHLKVQIPSIEEQMRIYKYLDKKTSQIETLISKKEELIETLKASRSKLISETVTKGLDKDVPMKDSGVEWIGEIPSHWDVKKLKYITSMSYGDSLPKENRDEGSISVYGSNGIVDSNILSNTIDETVIVGRKGSYGKINYSNNSVFVIDTAYYIDKRNTKNYIKWIYYMLQILELDKNSQDTGVPGLSREYAYNINTVNPSVEEQKEIVNYLDKKTSEIDELIFKIEEQIELLKKAKQKLITEVVTGKIDVTNL